MKIFAEEPPEHIKILNPTNYIAQISVEIDTVLRNLNLMNQVFTDAKLNYNYIFWRLKKANPTLLDQSEGMSIVLKEQGK